MLQIVHLERPLLLRDDVHVRGTVVVDAGLREFGVSTV